MRNIGKFVKMFEDLGNAIAIGIFLVVIAFPFAFLYIDGQDFLLSKLGHTLENLLIAGPASVEIPHLLLFVILSLAFSFAVGKCAQFVAALLAQKRHG